MPKDERPYAIYCRLSAPQRRKPGARVRAEDETVARQERLIREFADDEGLAIDEAHVYVDNHLSAWKDKGGTRPAWLAMMQAGAGQQLAGILIWRLDRFTRAPADMEALLKLAESQRLKIGGPNAGYIDLTTATGREQARGAANKAAYESDSTSERVRAALADSRARGEVLGGVRMFGFMRSSDPEQRPDEVAILREVARRALEGEALSLIAASLGERGILTADGNLFHYGTKLMQILRNPRYAGKVVYKGEHVGTMPGEPIFDQDTAERLQTLYASRRRGRPSKGDYFLSGIARCGSCDNGRTVVGALSGPLLPDGTRALNYRCPSERGGCGIAITAKHVEAAVRERVLTLLADPEVRAGVGAEDASLSAERDAALIELATVERELVDLDKKIATPGYYKTLAQPEAVRVILNRRWDVATAKLADLGPAQSSGLLPEVDAAQWDAASGPERSNLVRQLRLGVTILPRFQGASKNVWDPRRVVLS